MTEPDTLPDPAPVTPEPAVVAEGAPESAPPAGDLAEIKRVLEAALLVAGEAVATAQLARLFDPPLDAETIPIAPLGSRRRPSQLELHSRVASGGQLLAFGGQPVDVPIYLRPSPPVYSHAICRGSLTNAPRPASNIYPRYAPSEPILPAAGKKNSSSATICLAKKLRGRNATRFPNAANTPGSRVNDHAFPQISRRRCDFHL